MIRADEKSEWQEAVGGLAYVGTRAMTPDERARLERGLRSARRVVAASVAWVVVYVLLGALFVTHVRELGDLGIFVCLAFVPTSAAVGYGQSAARRGRWLRGDLAAGHVRVFEGDALRTEDDPGVRFLAGQPRFAAPPSTPPRHRIELLASCLPLPADGERFAPYRARPLRVALPPTIAAEGATRALSLAEREELRAYAVRRRRIGLEHGVGLVWGSLALFALGRWASHGFPRAEVSMFLGVRILVVSTIGLLAFVVLGLRRREARVLDVSATQGEVVGTVEGERLPCGLPWTQRGRPASWRRG